MNDTVKARGLTPAPPSGPAVRALAHELRDLYEEIADLLDDDQVERLPDHFTEDCLYKVISKENHDQGLPAATIFCEGKPMLRDRIVAMRETQVYEPRAWRHFVSGVRILSLEDGGALARTRANFLLTEAMSDAEPTLFLVGRYLDTVVRHDGRWLLRERLAVYDNHHVRRSLIVPV